MTHVIPTRSEEQNRLFQPICRDLSRQLNWHGHRLSADEWRWLICAAIRRQRMVPGISHGGEPSGVVMLGVSSRALSKDEMTQAITLGLSIGDLPWDYDHSQKKAVKWSDIVLAATGWNPADLA